MLQRLTGKETGEKKVLQAAVPAMRRPVWARIKAHSQRLQMLRKHGKTLDHRGGFGSAERWLMIKSNVSIQPESVSIKERYISISI